MTSHRSEGNYVLSSGVRPWQERDGAINEATLSILCPDHCVVTN
jgi:hypothetical protein